jgi:hypothetical protein
MGQLINDRMGPKLVEQLGDSSLVWANVVEPIASQGAGFSAPLAVALSADGSQIVDSVAGDGAALLGAEDRLEPMPPRTGSPNAVAFVAVLSRFRRGVFVVGGLHPDSGEPTGELWFTRLDADHWRPVASEVQPEHVLAATYAYASDELIVLDEVDGLARLWAANVLTGATRVFGQWLRHPEWDRHSLVVDRSGTVLLASSRSGTQVNQGKKEHRIARIELRSDPAAVSGIRKGPHALAYPPIADISGYTLVRALSQGNGKPFKFDRLDDLDLQPGTLDDLAEQL